MLHVIWNLEYKPEAVESLGSRVNWIEDKEEVALSPPLVVLNIEVKVPDGQGKDKYKPWHTYAPKINDPSEIVENIEVGEIVGGLILSIVRVVW